YVWEAKDRVVLQGPYVPLDSKAALAMGMVFHELATNAVKHGALSNSKGRVTIAWDAHVKDGTRITLEWREAAGTEICVPERTGFGSRLIKLEVTHELNGEVELEYKKSGLHVQLSFPLVPPASVSAKA